MRLSIYTVVAAFALTAASCSVSRDCQAPVLNLPDAIARDYPVDSLTIADVEWWNFYGDSCLCDIIRRTLDNNRDLLAAGARVEQMRQLYGESKAALLPEISGLAYGQQETYQYTDKALVKDPEYGLKAKLSWEADLWGSLSWAKRGGEANFLASVENQRAMKMTLIAEVATAYFRLTALDKELLIVRRTLDTRTEGLKQARLRYEGGLTSEMVFRQAQVEYATAAALIPNLEREIETTKSAIAILMGEYPGIDIERAGVDEEMAVLLPSNLPIGLPSTLLQRRPDVRASEMNLKGAMAKAGVAYADRFPKLTFTLTGGLENEEMGHFFKSPFTYLAGNLVGPIVDFGKRKAKYKAAVAAYDEARLAYEQKVLEVFKEANDAVLTYRQVRQTAELKANLCEAAFKYVELANLQYRAGTINYIDVLDAQRRYFDAQIGLSNAIRDENLAMVGLYKSLGGGWAN